MENPRRKIVLGLGNLLYRDEGFGIHAVNAMQAARLAPDAIELIDGGVLGLNLLPLVEDSSHLLVLDAVDIGQPPGTIYEVEGDQIPLFASSKLSEHQVGFQEVLGLALFRGNLPASLHMIGVQPQDLGSGIGMSQAVASSMPEVINRAMNTLKGWRVD